jgi:hypothetical protein
MCPPSTLEKDGSLIMAKTQKRSINPPGPSDRESLSDYSSTLQLTFDDLFQAAHDHLVLTEDPAASSGAVQTVSIVDNGTNVYLVVKTKRGWFKSSNFTAL